MRGYVVANYLVTNAAGSEPYPAAAVATVLAHGGEFLVGDRESEALDGVANVVTVVIRFPTKQAAREWYDSADYRADRDLRIENTEGFLIISDSLPGRR